MTAVIQDIANLVARQAIEATGTATGAAAAATSAPPVCESQNEYDGRLGVRISAIFVILVGSTMGAIFPVFASRHRGIGVPEWAFFVAKYFGSGVIIATAFIHLLAPANDALKDPCLTGPITDYDWVEGIALMTVFVLFFIELMAMRYATFGTPPPALATERAQQYHDKTVGLDDQQSSLQPPTANASTASASPNPRGSVSHHAPGEDHLSHTRDHHDHDPESHQHHDSLFAVVPTVTGAGLAAHPEGRQGGALHEIEDYAAQMTAIMILEFGVIFHSVFIGLTLAVSGKEFNTLYVVLVFHQTFEGLGLGTRLAAVPWPRKRRWTPYLFAITYGLTTPIAIAVGLGLRMAYAPGSQRALIINGCFDSISAGILLYTGLVELMAHEFMFNTYMRRARIQVVLCAFGVMCLGAGLMALLGKWA